MNGILVFIGALIQLYAYCFLIYSLLSWIPNIDRSHPAIQFLYQITEPVLEPIRRLVPPLGGMIDISAMVAMIALFILSSMITGL
ncbi:MAG: YggT family protein [Caldilineaceae bacterium]